MRHDPDDLNLRLVEALGRQRLAAKLERQLAWVEKGLRVATARRRKLAAHVKAEHRDLAAAEGGLHHLWLRFTNAEGERIPAERAEAARAAAAYEAVEGDVQFLLQERARLAEARAELGDPEALLADALRAKEEVVAGTRSPAGRRLQQLAEESADAQLDQREIDEALDAADLAIAHLDSAITALRSAGGLGGLDLLGGGLLVSMAKHGRLDEAQRRLTDAQHALHIFYRELGDVVGGVAQDPDSAIGPLAQTLDVLFDNFLTDLFVQSRIDRTLQATRAAREQVDEARKELLRLAADTQAQLREADQERRRLLLPP